LRVDLENSPTVRDVGNGQPGRPCHGLAEYQVYQQINSLTWHEHLARVELIQGHTVEWILRDHDQDGFEVVLRPRSREVLGETVARNGERG
jgi:hypothetical protein